MPRTSRPISPTGLYHVILRGNNHQIIFFENQDYLHFMDVLDSVMQEDNFKIHAFCLMPNHIHMLFENGDRTIGQSMQKIETRFVKWYNRKYNRSGLLAEGRYKSEAIDSEAYLLVCARYIMQNPMHAGIEPNPGHYLWSSYLSYAPSGSFTIGSDVVQMKITHTDLIRSYFQSDEEMISFFNKENKDFCMEYYSMSSIPDSDRIALMKHLTSAATPFEYQQMSSEERNQNICLLSDSGFSIRQINRYTGIPKGIVERTIKKHHESDMPKE